MGPALPVWRNRAASFVSRLTGRERPPAAEHRVLIIVENLPVERDTRVLRECKTLVDAGYGVSVICPRGRDPEVDLPELRLVDVRRYPPPPEGRSKLGFAWEFLYSWLATAALTVKVFATSGFDAIQACNPPDTYFAIALPFKAVGRPFVFDHHDLAPEMFVARFARRDVLVLGVLRALERATFLTADHVISTNESFREVALTRGHRSEHTVTVVRNGPMLDSAQGRAARPELKHGRRFLCCWVGVMQGVDDGVEMALRAIHHLMHAMGESDCHFAFLGDGEAFDRMRRLAEDLQILDHVSFTGWVSQQVVADHLASADVGLQPNPKTPRIEVSTAIKTMEYMAFALPVVAFDGKETRRSAADAAVYVKSEDAASYAAAVRDLLYDPARRAEMGRIGRRRVAEELAWEHQAKRYLEVYDRLLPQDKGPRGRQARPREDIACRGWILWASPSIVPRGR